MKDDEYLNSGEYLTEDGLRIKELEEQLAKEDHCFIIHDMEVHHETGEACLHLFYTYKDSAEITPAGTLWVQKEYTDHWFDNPFVKPNHEPLTKEQREVLKGMIADE